MILVDTSVWIELLKGRPGSGVSPEEALHFVTCGPVVQEVLQGLDRDTFGEGFRRAFLALPRLSDPLPAAIFLEAAEICRQGRAKGYAIRSSLDCLIAAVAIENRVPVWHRGRDFSRIARYTALEVREG